MCHRTCYVILMYVSNSVLCESIRSVNGFKTEKTRKYNENANCSSRAILSSFLIYFCNYSIFVASENLLTNQVFFK